MVETHCCASLRLSAGKKIQSFFPADKLLSLALNNFGVLKIIKTLKL
jgi:hypothetical protein